MHNSRFITTMLVLSFFCQTSDATAATYDVLIRGGRVIDGTGAAPIIADVAIRDGKIVKIAAAIAGDAETTIDAKDHVVAPGFIDMMGQTATPMLKEPKTALNLLTQGITTINAGEGASAAPLGPESAGRQGYSTFFEYFALLESQGLPINVAQTVGHTQIRRIVLGDVERRPSEKELKEMQALVHDAMRAGAIGLSTALIYPPAVYAQTEEIAALASVAGQYGGRYYTHMRNEGDQLLEAINEALAIGKRGDASVHIFHLKAAGRQNWGKMKQAIDAIRAARADGQHVTADIYPYINNGLGIAALIHPRHFAEGRPKLIARLKDKELRREIQREMESTGGWENWLRHAGNDWNRIIVGRSNHPKYRKLDGQSVAAMATANQESPWDTFFALVETGAFALPETMTDDNKILAMQQEFVSFCTDVGPAGGSRIASHPRAYGSFPRLLAHYVRDKKAIPLKQAVAQASAAAAQNILAKDRGRLKAGLAADVVIFRYDQLKDLADFRNPRAISEGVSHVLVNGQLVLHNGKQTDAKPGRVLRGPGYDATEAPHRIVTPPNNKAFANYDRSMQEFIKEHRVPGVSIAVTQGGKVVLARGYGYADLAQRDPVTPDSLFRIASISKPITAVAIMQLVEQNKLKLNDLVFDVLDYGKDIAAAESAGKFDSRLRQITIRHLLEHRGGWDRGKSFDAMFQSVRFARQLDVPPPAGAQHVIRAMFTQPLDFAPGERFAYSNFGYNLLGRVIEKTTGMPYEAYVQQHVLKPIGVTTMRIGATRLKNRAPNEVRYYHPITGKSVFDSDLDQEVPWPYGGWHLEAMDSHGAWIASATDLAKFAAALEDWDNSPLLRRESLERMHRRPPGQAGYDEQGKPKDSFYSLGWMNRVVKNGKTNHWHTGSLSGTATILIRRHDGKNFVALMNTRNSPSAQHLGRAIDQLLHKMANEASWGEAR